MKTALSPRQSDVLSLLGKGAREGLAPVVSEIAAQLGLRGESSITPHLEALERKGYVRIEGGVRGRQRQIRLTPRAEHVLGLGAPILGWIPAGPPTEVLPGAFEDAAQSPGIMTSQATADSAHGTEKSTRNASLWSRFWLRKDAAQAER